MGNWCISGGLFCFWLKEKTSGYYRKICFSVTVLYLQTDMADNLHWAYLQLDGQSAFSLSLARAGCQALWVKGCSLQGQGKRSSLKPAGSTFEKHPSPLSLVTDPGEQVEPDFWGCSCSDSQRSTIIGTQLFLGWHNSALSVSPTAMLPELLWDCLGCLLLIKMPRWTWACPISPLPADGYQPYF